MSVRIQATLTCDGCGVEVLGEASTKFTDSFAAGCSAREVATRAGWIELDHGRFYPRRHFCRLCQDKPMPKLKPLTRRKSP